MAARKNKITLSENWKERIRATLIMQRLEGHILDGQEMSATQINAAKLILGKMIPDLSRAEIAGDKDNPIAAKISIEFVNRQAGAIDNQDT